MTGRDRPTRAVFIAGNGHSGSTLLSLILGGHRQVVGLGEVTPFLQRYAEQADLLRAAPCSCGAQVGQCTLWGPIASGLDAAPGSSLVDRYRVVLSAYRECFGPERILLDSSKNAFALRALRDAGADVVVIHLMRDVRSWTVSMRDRDARRGERRLRDLVRRYGVRGASRFAKRSPTQYFRHWYRLNRAARAEIVAMDLPVVRLGYEELATAPVPILTGLCAEFGLRFEDTMLVPASSQSHSVLGNNMRLEPVKLAAIMYDTRWLTRREWMRPARMFRRIMNYNATEVYSNTALLPWR